MTGGISFGRSPDQTWLVSTSLSDPILERVVGRLVSDPVVADHVQAGIYFQCVTLESLEPAQREKVRRAVVEVTRYLLREDRLLRSADRSGWPPDPVRDGYRRQTVQRLLDIADSEAARRLAAGEDP